MNGSPIPGDLCTFPMLIDSEDDKDVVASIVASTVNPVTRCQELNKYVVSQYIVLISLFTEGLLKI